MHPSMHTAQTLRPSVCAVANRMAGGRWLCLCSISQSHDFISTGLHSLYLSVLQECSAENLVSNLPSPCLMLTVHKQGGGCVVDEHCGTVPQQTRNLWLLLTAFLPRAQEGHQSLPWDSGGGIAGNWAGLQRLGHWFCKSVQSIPNVFFFPLQLTVLNITRSNTIGNLLE